MSCFDDDVITELRDVLAEDLPDVIAEFVAQLRDNFKPLHHSLDKGDFAELKRFAHLLKGSSGNLGATALAEQFLLLERAATTEDAAEVARELAAAQTLAESCVAELVERGLLPSE